MNDQTDFSLKEKEVRNKVHTLIQYSMQLLSALTGRAPTPDELVRLIRVGMAFDKQAQPVLGDSSSSAIPAELIDEMEALISSSSAVEVLQEIENQLTRELIKSGPEEIARVKAAVVAIQQWPQSPTWPKNAIVEFAKLKWRGKPGPRSKVPREVYPKLVTSADSLRPVCKMVLDLQLKTNCPLTNAIKAVVNLNPDWDPECSFMLGNEELVKLALRTAKISRAARTTSKAHLLADALACTYAGYPASPSYSIQVVAEAKRLSKRSTVNS